MSWYNYLKSIEYFMIVSDNPAIMMGGGGFDHARCKFISI